MQNNEAGEFVRWESRFRNWITPTGEAGPSGEAGFRAEPGRYHLYVSLACPWAHRTLIYRVLKRLQEVITISVVHPVMPKESWVFGEFSGSTIDHLYGYQKLAQLYERVSPGYDGVVTVPVLYDRQRERIVNNESSEIIRMLNSAFNAWGDASVDLYPEPLRSEIDRTNAYVYERINNGVYKAGFAKTQAAYERAFDRLFEALDEIERRLDANPWLVGGQPTEADWRLFPTLLRFDPVYHGHFKCNRNRIIDFPNLWAWLRALYQTPGIAETVDLEQIKTHYYASHPFINPNRIIPRGPRLDFMSREGMEHYR